MGGAVVAVTRKLVVPMRIDQNVFVQSAEALRLSLASVHRFVEVGKHNSKPIHCDESAFLEMCRGLFVLKADQLFLLGQEMNFRRVACGKSFGSIESTDEALLHNKWHDLNLQG